MNKTKTKKTGPKASRAGGAKPEGDAIITKAESLVALLSPHRRKAAQVWIDGLEATKETYDPKSREWSIQPDFKERRENARELIAHLDGTPISRSLNVHADAKDLATTLTKLKNSPEAMRVLQSIAGGREIPTVQETGSEKAANVTREI